jgi:tripeptide aminopeptidase
VEGDEAQGYRDGIAERVARIHDALADARAAITARDSDILSSQIEVTEIPAPTGEEGVRAHWIAKRFEGDELADVHIDAAGNVVGTRPGKGEGAPVVVCAHLDTVFPREAVSRVRHEQSRIFAPGISDNGRGLAAMLALVRAIDGDVVRTQRPIRFVATTGEEGHGDLRGAKHHFLHGGAVLACVAIDGTGDERIVHRAVGSRRLRITYEGPGGHSWSDFGLANPLHACGTAIADIAALVLPESPQTTLTVSRAAGGLSVNSIPRTAWFEVDIRSTDDAPIREVEESVRRIALTAAVTISSRRRGGTPELALSIEVIGTRPGGTLAPSAALVATACAATREIGRKPQLATASTDANVPLSQGIPAIAIGGGGDGGDVHTTGEWYDNTDGTRGIARALTIVVAAAS